MFANYTQPTAANCRLKGCDAPVRLFSNATCTRSVPGASLVGTVRTPILARLGARR